MTALAEIASFEFLMRSAMPPAVAAIAVAGVRRAGLSASIRHMIWLFGIGSLLLLPLLAAVTPSLALPILPQAIALDRADAADPSAAYASDASDIGGWILTLYLIVAAGLLARPLIGLHALRVLRRKAAPLADAQWAALAQELGRSMGLVRPVELLVAKGPAMPMTWGTWKPKVLVPDEARHWSDERRRIVLLHELAHVARRDSLSRMAAALVCAVYWFHPLVWYASRQMRIEQEHACDDLVLAAGSTAQAYARNLLDIARNLQPPRLLGIPAVAIGHPTQLEERLVAIVGRRSRRVAGPAMLVAAGLLALASTLLVATATPISATSPSPNVGLTVVQANSDGRDGSGAVARVLDRSMPRILTFTSNRDVRSTRPSVRADPRQRPSVAPIPSVPPLPATPPAPPSLPALQVLQPIPAPPPAPPAIQPVRALQPLPAVPALPAIPPASRRFGPQTPPPSPP